MSKISINLKSKLVKLLKGGKLKMGKQKSTKSNVLILLFCKTNSFFGVFFLQRRCTHVRCLSYAILLSSLVIVFGYELQYHLHFRFLSSISNIASHADLWQYFSILLISEFSSSRTASERLKTFLSRAASERLKTSFVMSSLLINLKLS